MSNPCLPDQHNWSYRDSRGDKNYFDCTKCGQQYVRQVPDGPSSNTPVHCRSIATASLEGAYTGLITYITEQHPTTPQLLDHLAKLSDRYHAEFNATIKEIEAGVIA